MRQTASTLLLFTALATTACEKSSEPKGSGALAAADLELFKSLPGSSNLVFGGNYMKLQDFATNSALGKLASNSLEAQGPGMKAWIKCFVDRKDMQVAGAVAFTGGKGAELRMVMRGASIKDLEGCAKQASFPSTVAPDGKFLSVEIPSQLGKQEAGYLQLANGAIYTRQAFTLLDSTASVAQSTRTDLEADISGLKETAADSARLQGILAKVDRSKTLWFAGSADGTPIADKVGELYGSIEIQPGVAVDVSAELKDTTMVNELEEGIAMAKKQAGQLPADLKSVVEGIKFKRDGNRVRLAARVTDAQLESIIKQAGGMMGGGL